MADIQLSIPIKRDLGQTERLVIIDKPFVDPEKVTTVNNKDVFSLFNNPSMDALFRDLRNIVDNMKEISPSFAIMRTLPDGSIVLAHDAADFYKEMTHPSANFSFFDSMKSCDDYRFFCYHWCEPGQSLIRLESKPLYVCDDPVSWECAHLKGASLWELEVEVHNAYVCDGTKTWENCEVLKQEKVFAEDHEIMVYVTSDKKIQHECGHVRQALLRNAKESVLSARRIYSVGNDK